MKDQRLQIADIIRHIDDATLGSLNVPEFQRKYVWRASKVVDLVDSLWRGYPVGTLLLWESAYDSPRTALGTQGPKLWIVDGQQRVTSLALLFGKKPYWWSDANQWNRYYEKYDVLANVAREMEDLEFGLLNPVRRKSNEWLSVRRVLHSASLSELAAETAEKLGSAKRFAEIHEKLQSIKKIETAPLYEIIVEHELEDVAEIFGRLNIAGTRIRESDIVVALVAAKQPGWIRQKFEIKASSSIQALSSEPLLSSGMEVQGLRTFRNPSGRLPMNLTSSGGKRRRRSPRLSRISWNTGCFRATFCRR
jgi:Protein of unknown function DUF262